jgi:ADP-ribosyl-[dinitrogen reductase] hydrolase
MKNKFLGCLIGLAVGDAYGTTYEFTWKDKMPGENELPDKIVGGGPFHMKPGEWTDDTSMALCLAESLIEKGWDPHDQMLRYINWWQHGYNSVKGYCFDIGGATRNALSNYNMVGKFVDAPTAAGNGVLMRLAPVPMYFHGDLKQVLEHAAFQSFMTHPSSHSIECSMILGFVINKILSGETDKIKIVTFTEEEKSIFDEIAKKYNCTETPRIKSLKEGTYKEFPHHLISGDGYCVLTLEAALWAFLNSEDYKSGLKKVVSLGDDTDTTGAVYGQIAGAFYGIENIPWVEEVTWIEKIKTLAEQLYEKNVEKKV